MTDSVDAGRLEQAMGWQVRLTESPDLYTDAWSAWLAEDPRNREAWNATQAAWNFIGEHSNAPAVISLRRTALAYAYDSARHLSLPPRPWRNRLRVAAAAVLLAATGAWTAWYVQRPDTYRTQLGERQVVTLSDGSQVTLDSDSEVTVRYSANARALRLLRGQARFDVAHNIERPFTVSAQGRRVVATGTAFDVDLLGKDFLVTLLEGHVVVLPQSANLPVALDAGQQLMVSSEGKQHVTRVDLERVMAWERGRLIFNDEPLASVIERINRYTSQRIEVSDQRVADLRVSGVFHANDVGAFINTLTSYFPLKAEESKDGSLRLTYQPAAFSP